MPTQPLPHIPVGSNVFIDANILIYGLSGQSAQCEEFLERCAREELTGICLYEIVNEATHRFMLAEALQKGLIPKAQVKDIRQRSSLIATLSDYWQKTEWILNLNLLLLATDEVIVRGAQVERQRECLLTNDSMIVSCMRQYGITALATNDDDFERVSGIAVFEPDDI